MPKNIEDIVVTKSKKTIRDIPIPEGRKTYLNSLGSSGPVRPSAPTPKPSPTVSDMTPPPPVYPERQDMRPRGGGKKLVWLTAVVLILGATYFGLSYFAGGTLAYTPKSVDLEFNRDAFTAHKSGTEGLLFNTVKLSQDMGISVPASGEKDVSRKASGTIIVYNTTSSKAEKLDDNTRFESPDGKWYRIEKGITIPGAKTVSGKVQPGSVEAVVYADQAGEAYNIDLVDFTVPGYKGTKKQNTIYARSKTPMTGGFVGKEKDVSEADLAQAKTTLQDNLGGALIAQAQSQVPDGFIFLPQLSSVSFEDLPQSNQTEDSTTINMRANLSGAMFKKSDLASYLTARKTVLSSGDQVAVEDYGALTLTFPTSTPPYLAKSDTITFEVTGSTKAVWQIDESALKSDLAGKSRDEIASIMNNYPSITATETTIRPFWKSSFPSDIMRITLKELPAKQ